MSIQTMFVLEDFSWDCVHIKSLRPGDAYMRHLPRPSLLQIMACRLVGAKPLSEQLSWTIFSEISIDIHTFSFKKMDFRMALGNLRSFRFSVNALRSYVMGACKLTNGRLLHYIPYIMDIFISLVYFAFLRLSYTFIVDSGVQFTQISHYNAVMMSPMASQNTTVSIVWWTVVSGAGQWKNIKAPRHWPLRGEFTVNQWILRTNGQ